MSPRARLEEDPSEEEPAPRTSSHDAEAIALASPHHNSRGRRPSTGVVRLNVGKARGRTLRWRDFPVDRLVLLGHFERSPRNFLFGVPGAPSGSDRVVPGACRNTSATHYMMGSVTQTHRYGWYEESFFGSTPTSS